MIRLVAPCSFVSRLSCCYFLDSFSSSFSFLSPPSSSSVADGVKRARYRMCGMRNMDKIRTKKTQAPLHLSLPYEYARISCGTQ